MRIPHNIELLSVFAIKAFRDYFLLSRGGFWFCVLDECETLPKLQMVSSIIVTRGVYNSMHLLHEIIKINYVCIDLNMGPFLGAASKFNIHDGYFCFVL